MKTFGFIPIFFVLACSFLQAQSDSVRVISATNSSVVARTAVPESRSGLQMTKSPWGAMWRSLVLPGWGQYYVESYWKVPLALGAASFLVYKIVANNTLYLDKSDAVSQAEKAGLPTTRLVYEREFYRDKRDEYGFYLLGVYAIGVIDAYVGAHLYDFDVSDNLSASVKLYPTHVQLSMRWK